MTNFEKNHSGTKEEVVPEVVAAAIKDLGGEKVNVGAFLQEKLLETQLAIKEKTKEYTESVDRGTFAADENIKMLQTEIGRKLHAQLVELQAKEENIKRKMVTQLMDPSSYGLPQ